MIAWDAYPGRPAETEFDPATGLLILRPAAPPARVAGLAFDPAGSRLVTVPAVRYDAVVGYYPSDPVTVWDVGGGRLRDIPASGGASGIATAAGFTPAGDRLVIAEAERDRRSLPVIGVWDVATGTRLSEDKNGSPVTDLRVLSDGRVLLAAGAHVWLYPADLSGNPERLSGRPRRPPKAYRVAATADGAFLAGVGKTRATVWATDGTPLAHRDHSKSPNNGPAAFRPHAPVLAVGHGTVVDLWDYRSGEVVTPVGHKRPVWAVGFGPDGGTAYTAASDGAVIAWDADAGTVRQKFDFGTGKLYSAAVAPDGLMLALGGDDGRVTVVDLG